MTTNSPTAGFALDIASLESLKRRARENPLQSQKQVAQQFESLFLQMMIKRMREATPKDGLFDSDQTRMVQSLADEQLALHLSSPGIGLAQALLAQMQRYQGGGSSAVADSAPAGGSGARASTPGGESDMTHRAAGVPAFQPAAAPMRLHGGAPAGAIGTGREWGAVAGAGGSRAAGLLEGIRAAAAHAVAPHQARRRDSETMAVPGVDTPAHIASFVDKLGQAARKVAQASGLPLRLIMGQAALESGWGRHEIRTADGGHSYNLFGIKATGGWTGKVAEVMTTEYEAGVAHKVKQPFRAYDSYEHALADYAKLITQSERYREVTQAASAREAARRIQDAGYATDPNYADKLIQIMDRLPV